MKEKVFKFPNVIILNAGNLHPSALSVALVLYANMNRRREYTNSIENIAAASFKCKDTVRQALAELESVGYIRKTRNYVDLEHAGRRGYGRTTYRVIKPTRDDYTLVPYSWLRRELTPCTLQVLLTCRMFMIKEKSRSFPSIRKVAALINISKSTVCNALACIAELGILLVEHCRKTNEGFTSNSYRMIHHIMGMNAQPLTSECVTLNIFEHCLSSCLF